MHACGFISPIPVAVRREMHQRRVPLLTGSSRAPYGTATPSPAQSRSIDPLFGRVETELDSSMDREGHGNLQSAPWPGLSLASPLP
jgi:hypothetical protein